MSRHLSGGASLQAKPWRSTIHWVAGSGSRARTQNHLFAGSDRGGERAAAIYSLIGSANLNDLDQEAHLGQVLTTIANHPVNRLAKLLPWHVQLAAYKETSNGATHAILVGDNLS